MYTDFYQLKEKPFNLTPSTRFLYLGESHKEALAFLTYGVMERKGFILLTGEVGTGKTTMVQALLKNLDDHVQSVHISNPLFSPSDLISYLRFSALKKEVDFKSRAEFHLEFEAFLRQCLQNRKNFVLIIDEAQKLSFELLEEIRLLSNMETADEKLINIFLVGQPELNEKLSRPECRALLQRIGIRYHISPLNPEETGDYINTRLKVAGAEEAGKIFSKRVIKAIYKFSQGYPRVINILADNVLLLGYSREKREITPGMIKECYKDMKLDGSFSKRNHKVPEHHEVKKERAHTGRHLKRVLLLLFVLLFTTSAISQSGQNFLRRLIAMIPISNQTLFSEPPKEPALAKKQKNRETALAVDNQPEKEVLPVDVIQPEKPVKAYPVPAVRPDKTKKMNSLLSAEHKETWKTVVVKEGDFFSRLVADVYSRASEKNIELVQKHNPQIKDINTIEVGQKIIFPPPYPTTHDRDSEDTEGRRVF